MNQELMLLIVKRKVLLKNGIESKVISKVIERHI